MNKVYNVGLIGCGHIAETYFRIHKYFNNVKIIKCADINEIIAKKCAKKYNIEFSSVSGLLKDPSIDIILNLTIPKAHYEVSKKSLLAKKHVYAEKPMAINYKDGKELLKLAKKNKLYIGNAPDTFLGGGLQKCRTLLDKKIIGKVNLGNAIFAFPGVQSYHPNPEPWFAKKEGGPIIDMGPYFFTALVHLLGPAKKVYGQSMKVFNKRVIGIGKRKGKKFKVLCPTTYLAHLEFQNKAVIQITLSFDVISHQRNHIELYGSKGSMIATDPNMFGGSVYINTNPVGTWTEYKTNKMHLGKINIKSQSVRLNESPTNANYRGAGLAEMVYAIENKIENRCNGNLALHILDIIETTMKACNSNKVLKINSTCKKPRPFTEKEIKRILKN